MSRKPLKLDLNPLFTGPTLEARSRTGSPYRELGLDEIDVDPNQPRRVFSAEALSELAASIKAQGVLCPVLVKPLPGGSYRLIAGERRLRAARMAGLVSIPAVIDFDEDEADILPKQLVENLQRQDLSSLERALAVGQLRERFSWSVREIAEKLGLSKSAVQRALDVLALPDDLKVAIESGASESKVLMLSRVTSASLRRELLAELDNLTRDELERRIEELGENHESIKPKVSHRGTSGEARLSAEDGRIIEDIQKSLGLRVKIARSSKSAGKGRLLIEFYSEEDLRELYRRFVG